MISDSDSVKDTNHNSAYGGNTTVVIVNWNGERFLESLLVSATAEHPAEIIVVDNASTDRSRELLSGQRGLRCVFNNENVGFGSAANQGIELSRTKYVLILNADVEMTGGCLLELEDFLDKNPDVAVVAPQLLFPNRSIQPSCRTFPTIWKCFLFLSYLDRIVPARYRLSVREHSKTREVDQPMGAALLFRKNALDDVGLFDPSFFLYMEEVDLCKRLKEHGWKIYLHPEAKIIHHAGGSSAQDWERSQTNYLESLVIYFRKRSAPVGVLKTLLVPALWIRSLVLCLTGRFKEAAYYFRASFLIPHLGTRHKLLS